MPALWPCTGTVAVGGVRLRLVAMAMAGEAELRRAGVLGFQSNRTQTVMSGPEIRQWCLMSMQCAIWEPGPHRVHARLASIPPRAVATRPPLPDARTGPVLMPALNAHHSAADRHRRNAPYARRISSSTRHFVRHYVEMVVAAPARHGRPRRAGGLGARRRRQQWSKLNTDVLMR